MENQQPQTVTDGYPPLSKDATRLVVVCAVFCSLAIIFVGLRIWARRIKKQPLVFNDWAIFLALVLNCAQSALLIYACVAGGIGYHMPELVARWPRAATILAKCYVAAEPLWICTNSAVKFSILHLYIVIFVTRTFRRLCYAVMALTACYLISTFVRMFFLCTPLEAFWNPTVPGAHCLNFRAAYLSVTIINLALDLMVIALPLPSIWRLQLRTSKKIAVSGIFCIGIVITVMTILRITAVLQLDFADTSYTLTPDGIWSELEPSLGIVNACLPVLQPVASKISQTFRSSKSNATGDSIYPLKLHDRFANKQFHGSIPGVGTAAGIGSKTRFQRLDESSDVILPHTKMPGDTMITSPGGGHLPPGNGITVTSEFAVEHE